MIEFKGVYDIYSPRPAPVDHRAVRKAEATPVSVSADMDVVQLSPEASLRSKLDAMGKSAQAGSAVSPQRLAELRAQYQGDECPISVEDTAHAMLGRVLGSGLFGQGAFH